MPRSAGLFKAIKIDAVEIYGVKAGIAAEVGKSTHNGYFLLRMVRRKPDISENSEPCQGVLRFFRARLSDGKNRR